MSQPRFIVEWVTAVFGEGWCVFDTRHERRRRITIPFASFAEAERHRDNIHKIYLRFGW